MKKAVLFLIVACFSLVLQAQTSKTINSLTPGGLFAQLTAEELNTVTNLTLSGTIDARDFKTMKEMMTHLAVIDLTHVTVAEYTGKEGTAGSAVITYPANTLPEWALAFKISLTSISLPVSITTIDSDAFYNCNQLTQVIIPNSIIFINDAVFANCYNLPAITIPASVTSIRLHAFAQTWASIIVDSENPNYSSMDGVLFNKDKTSLIYCPVSKEGTYTIPSTVKTISDYAFFKCSLLTSIIFPNSITTIGEEALYGCIGLTSVILPNSLASIETGVFSGCEGLTSVDIPASVTKIGNNAFSHCIALTSVNLPNSATAIGDNAFSYCIALTSVNLPNSISTIGMSAFSECINISQVILPNSLTSIEKSVFSNCTGLTSVIIPNSVTTIGTYAFSNCTGLTSVNLPNSVTTIGEAAFYRCTGITSIIIPASVTSIKFGAFWDCSQLSTIYAYPTTPVVFPFSDEFVGVDKTTCILNVPAESLELYQSAAVWKDFSTINVITSTGKEIRNELVTITPNPAKEVITIHAQKGMVSIYNSKGKQVISQLLDEREQINISSLPKGLYVVVVNGKSIKMIKE